MKKPLFLIALSTFIVLGISWFGSFDPLAALSSQPCRLDEVVFDSNRSGDFGIYAACLDGSQTRVLINSAQTHELYPAPSPDGSLIAFARADSATREAPADVWLFDRDTKEEKLLIRNATFPTFTKDGKSILFERGRRAVFLFDLAGSTEKQIFPWPGSSFDQRILAKPRISDDLSWLYFISEIPLRWSAWKVNLKTGAEQRVGHGCQANPLADSEDAVWVQKRKDGSGTDILLYNDTALSSSLLHFSGEKTFAYYPQLHTSENLLLYARCSGCTKKTNSHENGNYEIIAVDLQDASVREVTANTVATNRWPKLLPKR